MAIDELNVLETETEQKNRSVPYEQYFGEMKITEEQKQERIEFSEKFEKVMTLAFTLISMEIQLGSYEYASIIEMIANDYQEIYSNYMEVDQDIIEYTHKFADDVVNSTIDSIDVNNNQSVNELSKNTMSNNNANIINYDYAKANEVSDSIINKMLMTYALSLDRAMFISENEANTSLNYKDFKQALLKGKTKKQWVGISDSKQRKDHTRVTGQIKKIYEPFIVGGYKMQYPKDMSAPAKETVNCRCSIKYLK